MFIIEILFAFLFLLLAISCLIVCVTTFFSKKAFFLIFKKECLKKTKTLYLISLLILTLIFSITSIIFFSNTKVILYDLRYQLNNSEFFNHLDITHFDASLSRIQNDSLEINVYSNQNLSPSQMQDTLDNLALIIIDEDTFVDISDNYFQSYSFGILVRFFQNNTSSPYSSKTINPLDYISLPTNNISMPT